MDKRDKKFTEKETSGKEKKIFVFVSLPTFLEQWLKDVVIPSSRPFHYRFSIKKKNRPNHQ